MTYSPVNPELFGVIARELQEHSRLRIRAAQTRATHQLNNIFDCLLRIDILGHNLAEIY